MKTCVRHFYIRDVVILSILVGGASVFAAGFFFSDPLLTREGSYGIHHQVTHVLELLGVLLVPSVAALYLFTRQGKVSLQTLTIVGAGIIAALLIAYPVFVEFYFSRNQTSLRTEFHPYLQIKPKPFELRSGKTPYPIRVVALGGSTTRWPNSKGVQWTELLENELRSLCSECDVQVYNQGMDWYTSLHSLINYAANIRSAKPDIVIAMHGVNDLMNNLDFGHLSNGEFRRDYGHYLGPVARLIQRPGPMGALYDSFRRHWFAPDRGLMTTEEYPGIAPFKENLMTLADLVDKDEAKLVLMTEAYLYRPDLSEVEKRRLVMYNFEGYGPSLRWSFQSVENGMAKYADATREVAKERGALLVDLEQALPKSLEYFVDDVHYSDRTYPVVAEKIARAIAPVILSAAKHRAG